MMRTSILEQASSDEMAQKPFTYPSMFGRRSAAPRPLSEATLILDTDDEDDEDYYNESTHSSPSSLEYDSQSTLSIQDELPTPPDTAGLGGYTFHFDPRPIKGPVGPHLFRSGSTDSSQEILALSPIPVKAAEPARVSLLPKAVAGLDPTQVKLWSPQQVADWIAAEGLPDLADKFLIHDIYGSVLLELSLDDLKEIEIETYGKRKRILSSIQKLRNSSMATPATLAPHPTEPEKPARSLSRAPRPDEAHFVAPKRTTSRRGRKARDDIITPAESISIIAIEQVLPEPHSCSKGEACSTWRKQQRKMKKIKEDFGYETSSDQPDAKSTIAPSTVGASVAGSSDVLGPVGMSITSERLDAIQPRDPQESVRQFLDFQSTQRVRDLAPPPAPSAVFAAKQSNLLLELPKLRIPSMVDNTASPDRTPISALRNPTRAQNDLKTALRNDPYHYGGVASPVDVYRIDTPMSMTDLPITAVPIDPCQRDVSQSVPPEMRFGSASTAIPDPTKVDPVQRCSSTRPARRRPSFTPAVAPVMENQPVVTDEAALANHAGWMRKRKTTRLLKHEWQDHYFDLHGSKLDMYNAEHESSALDTIDIDEYEVHAYTTASSSKLKSAFSKATGAAHKEPSFAFTLVSDEQKDKKMFEKARNHHFAVNSGKDRVEWMRKLMLAKALKKNTAASAF